MRHHMTKTLSNSNPDAVIINLGLMGWVVKWVCIPLQHPPTHLLHLCFFAPATVNFNIFLLLLLTRHAQPCPSCQKILLPCTELGFLLYHGSGTASCLLLFFASALDWVWTSWHCMSQGRQGANVHIKEGDTRVGQWKSVPYHTETWKWEGLS